jgi:hypothetical protein
MSVGCKCKGGKEIREMWICGRFNIFGLVPEKCADCQEYLARADELI